MLNLTREMLSQKVCLPYAACGRRVPGLFCDRCMKYRHRMEMCEWYAMEKELAMVNLMYQYGWTLPEATRYLSLVVQEPDEYTDVRVVAKFATQLVTLKEESV